MSDDNLHTFAAFDKLRAECEDHRVHAADFAADYKRAQAAYERERNLLIAERKRTAELVEAVQEYRTSRFYSRRICAAIDAIEKARKND